MATAAYLNQAYLAYFGRPVDYSAVTAWSTATNAQVEQAFFASAESQALYGSEFNAAQINSYYLNLFGRGAEPAGIQYWLGQVALGNVTPAGAAVAILNGAQGTDAVAVQNKLVASAGFTTGLDTTSEIIGYTGDSAAASARAFLATVTATPATQAEIDAAIVASTMGGGQTFTLTNDTDIATSNTFNSGLVYTPGGDDRINALQDEDQLTGSGVAPTLNATLGNSNDNGANIITPKLTGIEVINVAFTGSGGPGWSVTALDMQDSTGQTDINITRISQATNVAEVGNIETVASRLSLKDTHANSTGIAEFSYSAGVLHGLNTGDMTVSNVQIMNLNIGENTSFITGFGVGTNGFENLTFHSDGTAANTVGTLNLPMDTGTAGVLTIVGSANLTLGRQVNVVNAANNALVEAAGVWVAGTGIAQAGGRIAAIDASAFTGNLSIVLDNILDVGKADTSGVVQNVTVTGGTGNDTFVLYDAVQAGDSIDGGAGTDTLLFYTGASLASVVSNVEAGSMLADGSTAPAQIALDYDFLPNATSMNVRNISAIYPAVPINFPEAPVNFLLTDMTAAQAAAISVQHSTTGNNQVGNTKIEAAVKVNTATDLLGIAITEGTNVDPRFNFTIDTVVANTATSTTAAVSTFESVTLTDADSESNSVLLQNFAQHTGTITLTGGVAGTFLNLDLDTAGANVTVNTTGANGLAVNNNQGMLGIDTSGGNLDLVAGNFVNVGVLATEVRLGAATINAAAELANVIVRVGTNAASVNGAQAITMGAGNDVVIFDLLNNSTAGLTISDTVMGGAGNDTLAIDGQGVIVSISASEWTNVSGFETLQLVGNGAAAIGTIYGQNSYNMVLTNDLITTNGAGMLAVLNDNDISNNAASGAQTVTVASNAVSGVTIDARTLDAAHHFSYKGDEGAQQTVDKFILTDPNINGANVIDGGAMNNIVLGAAVANTDVLEIRNNAVVTTGDLANLKNIGIIAASNDQAVAQTLNLQLNDTVVDSMVDSFHVASTTEIETLTVRVNNALDVTAVASTILKFDGSQLTAKSNVSITLDATNPVAGDGIQLGFGTVSVQPLGTSLDLVGTYLGAVPTADGIIVSAAQFGIAAGAVGTSITANGSNVIFAAALGGGAATDRIYVIEGTNITGGGANDIGIYYDADGSGAGAAVLIGVLVDTGAGTLSGGANTGLTIVA